MNEEKHDHLLERDWGDEWDQLPAAELPGSAAVASTQITLRVPTAMLDTLRLVARRKRLPTHALARSWIADRLAAGRPPIPMSELVDIEWPTSAQLSIELDVVLARRLKDFSHRTRIPYHRLARLWIQEELDAQRPVRD